MFYTHTCHSVHSEQSRLGKVILSVFYTLTFPSAHSGQSPIGKVTLSVIFYSHLPQCSQLAVRYREGNSIGVLHSHLPQCSQWAVRYREDNSIGVLHSYLPPFSQRAVTYREGNSIGVLHSQCWQWAVAYREGNSVGGFSLSPASVLTVGSHIIIGKVILSVFYTPTFHSAHSGQSHNYREGKSIGVLHSHFPECSQRAVTYREGNSIGVLHSHLSQCSQWAVMFREGNSIGVLHSHLSRQELKTVSDLSCLSNGLLRLFRIKKKLEQSWLLVFQNKINTHNSLKGTLILNRKTQKDACAEMLHLFCVVLFLFVIFKFGTLF